jgi:hypothetical protein
MRTTIRGALVLVGGLIALGGLLALVAGPETALPGLWSVAVGLFLVAMAVIERARYRSEAAEKDNAPAGPGGGEILDVEPVIAAAFSRTDEVFVDPSSGHRMRVFINARTGERRYVAEA